MKIFAFILSGLLLTQACKRDISKDILEKCVQAHGGKAYNNLDISFKFRKYEVLLAQNKDNYTFSRSTLDSASQKPLQDILNNGKFYRILGTDTLKLSPKDHEKYQEAVNSIAYFVLLPYKLLDPAVQSSYLGEKVFEDTTYHKIKVSFKKEGGGKDHTDTFCYWINAKTYTLDFLAYTNGGPRFRKAKNAQIHKGIRFQDYDNFEILTDLKKPEIYDSLYLSGKKKYLSEIVQSNFK